MGIAEIILIALPIFSAIVIVLDDGNLERK